MASHRQSNAPRRRVATAPWERGETHRAVGKSQEPANAPHRAVDKNIERAEKSRRQEPRATERANEPSRAIDLLLLLQVLSIVSFLLPVVAPSAPTKTPPWWRFPYCTPFPRVIADASLPRVATRRSMPPALTGYQAERADPLLHVTPDEGNL